MRVAFVSTYPPRRCGIATFTADLIGAVREADAHTQCRVAAIDERNSVRAYGSEVRWRIKQGSALPYRAAAREIDRSNAEIVCVQHEFGLYGLWKGGGFVGDHWIEGMYEDHLTPFLEELKKPALVNMHTVLPEPSPAIREAVRAIAETAHGLVVMAETAVDILDRDYGIKERPLVIPHGMPHIEPKGRRRLKAKLGLDGRTIVSTFGLVGPGKGLEYAIEAMPAVAARHPEALYLIAGQTHPELLKQRGEEYRNRLQALVDELDLGEHVLFVNQYLDQKDIIEYLLATDVYVTPYLDPNQITSGTLSYALGAGKAVVSTPYLHAQEALAKDRGILVEFRSAEAIADAVNTILDDPKRKARLEKNAYAYANQATWPKTGARFLSAMQELVDEHAPKAKKRKDDKAPLQVAHRLKANPLLRPEDFTPSQPGFEVISTINPGVAQVGDETVLLVRVAERPSSDAELSDDAPMIDLSGPEPRLAPMPERPASRATDRHGVLRLRSGAAAGRDRLRAARSARPRPLRSPHDPLPERSRRVHPGAGRVHGLPVAHLASACGAQPRRRPFHTRPRRGDPPDGFDGGIRRRRPRITEIDGVFHITYVAVSRLGITTARMTTTDFRTFERQGTMLYPDQKDVILFPEKVGGKYLAFTRPMPGSFGRVLGLWIAESEDLIHWGRHRPVAGPRHRMWDEMRIGASLVPIRTDEGWLELYHGADRMNRYGMGAILLDAGDPTKVLARSTRPLMVPEHPYEHDGFLHDVVFPSGHIDLGDGHIRVYYGAADTTLCAADMALDDVFASLTPV